MDSKKAFATATMVLILLAAVFLVINVAVAQIDVSSLPPQLADAVQSIQAIFNYGPVVLLSAFLFGMFGYLKNVFKEKAKEAPEGVYNINKMLETVMLFLSAITPFVTMLSTPPLSTLYPEAGPIATVVLGAAVAVIKIAMSQFKELNKQNSNG